MNWDFTLIAADVAPLLLWLIYRFRSCEMGLLNLTAGKVTQIFGFRKHKRLRGKFHTMLEKIDHVRELDVPAARSRTQHTRARGNHGFQRPSSSGTLAILIDVLSVAGMFALMAWLNWDFTLIAAAVAPLLLWLIYRFKRAVKKATKQEQEK